MRGIIIALKENIVKNAHGGSSYNIGYKNKEIPERIPFESLIHKMNSATDIDTIDSVLLYDTTKADYRKYIKPYKQNKLVPEKRVNKEIILREIEYILENEFSIELFKTGKLELANGIILKLEKEGISVNTGQTAFSYDDNKKLKAIILDLNERNINWEHSTETDAYQQYGEQAWEDDDNMEPDYTDFLNLKKQIEQVLPDYKCELDYYEKCGLTLIINI